MKKYVEDYKLCQDHITSMWGCCNVNTLSHFNAFWNDIGIFHDVFEHYFENTKYFKGDAAFNIGGEIAAMGHLAYYYYELGLPRLEGWGRQRQTIINTTQTFIDVREDNFFYGDRLICNVPYQKPCSYNIEDIINEHWDTICVSFERPIEEAKDSFEWHKVNAFRKSVTLGKIRNLYRWGYRAAARMVPDTKDNWITLERFLSFWKTFTKMYTAEEVCMSSYEYIDFKLKTNCQKITWSAELRSIDSAVATVNVYDYDGFAVTKEEMYV